MAVKDLLIKRILIIQHDLYLKVMRNEELSDASGSRKKHDAQDLISQIPLALGEHPGCPFPLIKDIVQH